MGILPRGHWRGSEGSGASTRTRTTTAHGRMVVEVHLVLVVGVDFDGDGNVAWTPSSSLTSSASVAVEFHVIDHD